MKEGGRKIEKEEKEVRMNIKEGERERESEGR